MERQSQNDDFTAFAEFVDQHLSHQKDKKIAMYCTGGILWTLDCLFKTKRIRACLTLRAGFYVI